MTLTFTQKTPSEYRDVPWNDGAISTLELARSSHLPDSTQPFAWQLTMTKRESSGEMGRFPGYDRHIMQLSGKTITLQHAKHGEHKLSPLVPYAFNGDWETQRRLVGKAEDLSLLIRAGQFQTRIERVDLRDWKPLHKSLSRHMILWVYQGTIEWNCLGEKRILKEQETCTVDGVTAVNYILRSKRAVCFLFMIDEVG